MFQVDPRCGAVVRTERGDRGQSEKQRTYSSTAAGSKDAPPCGGRHLGPRRVTEAGACRAQLRLMGVRVTQRRSGVDEVPDELRLAGVTVREYEVLRLLGARLANNEIAAQLYLSRRTVEKHVSSLLTKTGLTNRLALGKLATTHED
ncbi:response regulator transcription factor [Lentzea sp. HUAS TT2]|uniref:helix-turn-helix transcriptional regulator n=1 Tax=Lentzea sp. HUAS TT2 TaxID=3447454 RepID=UPI003F6F7E20